MLHIPHRLVIVLLIIFITGCSAEYNITINKNSDLIESLDITENDYKKFETENKELYDTTLKEYLKTDLKWPTPAYNDTEENPLEPKKIDTVNYYKKKDNSNDKLLSINYSFNFTNDTYKKSNIVNTCYDYEYSVLKDNISFKTTSEFKCFNKYKLLDQVKFTLNTKCEISGNYDINDKTAYTWNIDKETKSIEFNLNCDTKKHYNESLAMIVIIFSCLFIIFFLIIMLRIIFAMKNRI